MLMNITEDQKKLIISKAVGMETSSLVLPLIEDHIFPWLEKQDSFDPDSLIEEKSELREIALNYLIQKIQESLPHLSEREILEDLPVEQLHGAIILTGLAVQVVGQIITFDNRSAVMAHEATENIDEEYEKLLEQK
jgi:hypothetical protein